MKSSTLLLLLALFFSLWIVSCKKETQADATQPLQQSFQAAEPQVKQAIESVNTSLKSGNYADATKALAPVVDGRKLTEPQKQAIGVALHQINQAIAVNPALDTKEMYELRAKLFKAVDSGPRF